ncbi:PAS domain S-box protein [uncultured Sphingomonas sp.]|uniref:PAS domain S-box protein n=1 Tax=uncultured Sphingomonas sp. TaxID=158754 RepID=UPI0030F7A969
MTDVTPTSVALNHNDTAFAAIASLVVRQATTFVSLCDAGFRPYFLNAAGRDMVGLSAEADIADYAMTDFFTPEDRAIVEAVALPTLLRDGHWQGELRFRHFSNASKETEVRWSAFTLTDSTGALIGAATFTTDITVRKQAERALRDQQALLASLLENLPLGVGVYDQRGELVHSNQRLRDYVGLTHLPSREPASSRRWHGYDANNVSIPPDRYPGARALRGEIVVPGVDFLYETSETAQRWMRVSAVPFRREDEEANEAIVVVQDVDDLKRAAERIEAAGAVLASRSRFFETTLSSIPDLVYAFDRQHRFAYANPAMLSLFGFADNKLLGKTFGDLDYPRDLADKLDGHLDQIFADGSTAEDEVFFRSPTGYAAYFNFVWGPVFAADGAVELVVGVSRDTSERRALEEAVRKSEERLRAASDLVGLAIYSWDPTTGALDWDDRLRAMWGLPPGAKVDLDVYEGGIHPDDRAGVRRAIAACIDPAGDGRYGIEYRVIGRDDGIVRHIATSGQTRFAHGRAVSFIGAAIDVTAQRRNEAAVRASEAQFQGFAEHSSNLIWIADLAEGVIVYRSAAYERIWGVPCEQAPDALTEWIKDVHADDRQQVEHALASVGAGEVAQFEYRIVRPSDGTIRWLRDTSFPIPQDGGAVTRIGGITEDLTQEDVRQVYIVGGKAVEARRLAALVRGLGYRARIFESAAAILDLAPILAPGCVLVDLRKSREEGLSVPRELKARSVALPTICLDAPGGDVAAAVAAMKAGAIDYVIVQDEASLRAKLTTTMADCHGAVRPTTRNENAGARLARLTPREREVLMGLVEGGTNKSIAQKLGISPRTVELHRAQVMNRLNASNLTELLQIALAAGVAPPRQELRKLRKTT